MFYYIILCYVLLYYVILYHIILCSLILYYIILYYIILCYVISYYYHYKICKILTSLVNTLYICVWDCDDSGTTSYFHGFRIGTASALGLVEASQVWFQAAAERWMDANTSQLRCSIVHLVATVCVAICCYLLLVDLRDSCNSCVQLLPMPKPSDQVESTCSMRTCPERTERTKRTETSKFKQSRFSNCKFLSSQRQDLEEAPVDSLPAREDDCAACAACIMSS